MMRTTDTICYKHDSISGFAEEIIHIVEKAKEDGCRMESALQERKERIAELEKENAAYQTQIEKLEDTVIYLEGEVKIFGLEIKELNEQNGRTV